jgi:hypothetical protein
MGDRHRFEPNILKLSHSENLDDALLEWYFFSQDRVHSKSERCVCNSNITIVHTYLNSKTGQACLLGGNCHRKMKESTRQNGLQRSDSRTCVEFEPTTYTEITDMTVYSAEILLRTLLKIRNLVVNTYNILELQEYKRLILTFAIDTREVVQLINDRIQQRSAEIERDRLERERLEQIRQKDLQKQREIVAEQRRLMQEAARVAAEQEIDRKRQQAVRKLIEQQRENARKEVEKEQQRIRDAERRAEQAALDLIREEKRRVERIEMDKIQAVEREQIRIKKQQIDEERKKELNEQFDFYCKCKNTFYKKFNPHSDEFRCKNCKKVQPNV